MERLFKRIDDHLKVDRLKQEIEADEDEKTTFRDVLNNDQVTDEQKIVLVEDVRAITPMLRESGIVDLAPLVESLTDYLIQHKNDQKPEENI